MGLEPVLRERASISSLFSVWQDVVESAGFGACNRAASLLHIAKTIGETENDHAIAAVLPAAHHIGLACRQHSDVVVEYHEAQVVAARRERLLQKPLVSLLSHLTGQAPPPSRERTAIISSPTSERTPTGPGLCVASGQSTSKVDQTRSYAYAKASEMDLPTLSIYCLDRFRMYENGRLIDGWPGNKYESILKYMVDHRERSMHRDVLIDRSWRLDDPEPVPTERVSNELRPAAWLTG